MEIAPNEVGKVKNSEFIRDHAILYAVRGSMCTRDHLKFGLPS